MEPLGMALDVPSPGTVTWASRQCAASGLPIRTTAPPPGFEPGTLGLEIAPRTIVLAL